MQIIVEVGIDPASYVNKQYQHRVRRESEVVCKWEKPDLFTGTSAVNH